MIVINKRISIICQRCGIFIHFAFNLFTANTINTYQTISNFTQTVVNRIYVYMHNETTALPILFGPYHSLTIDMYIYIYLKCVVDVRKTFRNVIVFDERFIGGELCTYVYMY